MTTLKSIVHLNGSVTIHTPVAITTRHLYPSQFHVSQAGERLIFLISDGTLSHLVKGKVRDFARIEDGKVHKLSHGWRDTVGDYIVALLFPELFDENTESTEYDLSDFRSHYIYAGIRSEFRRAEFKNVRFILRPAI